MITIARNINKSLLHCLAYNFSSKNTLINEPSSAFTQHRVELKDNIWRTPDPSYKKSAETHLSNAQYLIHKTPVVYSDQAVVRCMGGVEIGPGHPQVYIQLNTKKPGEPVACKYCGMRFALKHH